jgi:hypothetical protein
VAVFAFTSCVFEPAMWHENSPDDDKSENRRTRDVSRDGLNTGDATHLLRSKRRQYGCPPHLCLHLLLVTNIQLRFCPMMCAFLQSSPHHHQTTIMSKYKAPRRFNVLASEDTHSDYFRRSLMVASTERRVRFSSTIKVSYPIPRPPLDGEEDEEEEETNAASSPPSHCSSSSWYTAAELSTLRANATEAVRGYRQGDRSVDMHGLEKHVMIVPTTTTTTTTTTSFCAARRHSASSYHQNQHCDRHQSPSPPPPVQRKVAPLNNSSNTNTKRNGSTTNSPNSAARAA